MRLFTITAQFFGQYHIFCKCVSFNLFTYLVKLKALLVFIKKKIQYIERYLIPKLVSDRHTTLYNARILSRTTKTATPGGKYPYQYTSSVLQLLNISRSYYSVQG